MKLVHVTEITEVEQIDIVNRDINNSVGDVINESIARVIKHRRKMREDRPERTPDRMKSITVEFEDSDTPYLFQTY